MNKKAIEPNVLNKLHNEFANLPVLFRNRVCEECNYSVPTYYRKVRGKARLIDGKVIPALSTADREKIEEIGESVKDYLVNSFPNI